MADIYHKTIVNPPVFIDWNWLRQPKKTDPSYVPGRRGRWRANERGEMEPSEAMETSGRRRGETIGGEARGERDDSHVLMFFSFFLLFIPFSAKYTLLKWWTAWTLSEWIHTTTTFQRLWRTRISTDMQLFWALTGGRRDLKLGWTLRSRRGSSLALLNGLWPIWVANRVIPLIGMHTSREVWGDGKMIGKRGKNEDVVMTIFFFFLFLCILL